MAHHEQQQHACLAFLGPQPVKESTEVKPAATRPFAFTRLHPTAWQHLSEIRSVRINADYLPSSQAL